jgi:GNAT superfamily N-acetyltransferase
MVLFRFDDIIKNKYKVYKEKNNNKEIICFDEFRTNGLEQFSKFLPFYFSGINQNYIQNILLSEKTHIIISCIDNVFSIKNSTSMLIYHKTKSSNCVKYYILLLGTHERFRKFGYGTIVLDEFIEYVKKTNPNKNKKTNPNKNKKTNPNKNKKILLKSLESSMSFYFSYGFVQSELKPNKLFYKYETSDELKSNQEKILELNIE